MTVEKTKIRDWLAIVVAIVSLIGTVFAVASYLPKTYETKDEHRNDMELRQEYLKEVIKNSAIAAAEEAIDRYDKRKSRRGP